MDWEMGRDAAYKRLFACGSMEHSVLSVCRFCARRAQKRQTKRRKSTAAHDHVRATAYVLSQNDAYRSAASSSSNVGADARPHAVVESPGWSYTACTIN